MPEPFVGEIRMVGFNFPPAGWAACDGQLVPIAQNMALFSLLGTTFGGDGQVTFALPDLRGRAPVHMGTGPGLSARALGDTFGSESATLTTAAMPAHTHVVKCNSAVGDQTSPVGRILASEAAGVTAVYGSGPGNGDMAPSMLASSGGGQGHDNMQPCLALNFVIALQGVFPSHG